MVQAESGRRADTDLMPRLWPDPRDNKPEPRMFLRVIVASGMVYYGVSWWRSVMGG